MDENNTQDMSMEEAMKGFSLNKVKDGDMVIIGGIITEITKKITKNNANMAFIKVEDLYASMEVVVFPKTYEKCKALLEEDGIVLIKGRVSMKEEEKPKLLCETVDLLLSITSEKIYIQIEEERAISELLPKLKEILFQYRGSTPVYLFTKKERRKFRLDREYWVQNDLELMSCLRKRFGDENVKLV